MTGSVIRLGGAAPRWSTQRRAEPGLALGLCGSGLIDAVARQRLDANGQPEFVIAWAAETAIGQDITVT